MELEHRVARLERQARAHRLVMAAQFAALVAAVAIPAAVAKPKAGQFTEIVIGEPGATQTVIRPNGISISRGQLLTTVEASRVTLGDRRPGRQGHEAVLLEYHEETGAEVTVNRLHTRVSLLGSFFNGLVVTTHEAAGSARGQALRVGYGRRSMDMAESASMRVEMETGEGPKKRLVQLGADAPPQ
jgi:hypothetical protein